MKGGRKLSLQEAIDLVSKRLKVDVESARERVCAAWGAGKLAWTAPAGAVERQIAEARRSMEARPWVGRPRAPVSEELQRWGDLHAADVLVYQVLASWPFREVAFLREDSVRRWLDEQAPPSKPTKARERSGAPLTWNWPALEKPLAAHVREHGRFESRAALVRWIADNAQPLPARRNSTPNSPGEPDVKTIKAAILRHKWGKFADSRRGN